MSHQHGHGGGQRQKAIKRQDIILMASTFIVGIIAGGYLYIVGFAPQFADYLGNNQTQAFYEDFVIDGEIYGDQNPSAGASFQILKDGSFRYIPAGETGSANIKQGLVPKSVWTDIKSKLTEKNLVSYSQAQVQTNCPSPLQLGYDYKVTLKGTDYNLDTCKTTFSPNSEAALALENLWNYFRKLPR